MKALRTFPERMVALLAACSCACAPAPAALDAGASWDARTPTPDTGPIAICGNGWVEPGESCDDEGREDGDGCDSQCRFEAYCGDGKLDEGEVCDDGNERWGDGCDGRCASDERCGNGTVDPARLEVCDDGNVEDGDGCAADCGTLEGCGDGALAPGEVCDDGNGEWLDACGPDCRPRVTLSLHTLEAAGPEVGCDLTGDGLADNRLAVWLRAARMPLNRLVGAQLGTATLVLLDVFGLDDPWGRSDDDVAIALYEGWDGDDDPENNLVEGALLQARARDLPLPAGPRWLLRGAIHDRVLDVRGGRLVLPFRRAPPDPCDLDAWGLPWPMARVRLRATLESAAEAIVGLRDGLLCGAFPVSDAAAMVNPLEGLLVLRGCGGVEPTVADLLLGGTSVFGITLPAVQPDVDVDGDGLERFELEGVGARGCQPVIRACVDGDGTRYEGHDCATLPQMADGISMAVELAGVASRLRGVLSDEQIRASYCP